MSMLTVSEKLNSLLNPHSLQEQGAAKKYTYAYLAGGMIAEELVHRNMLWADIVCEDFEVWSELQKLFLSDTLDINLKIWNTKNTEPQGYYFSKLLEEMKWVIHLLTPPQSPSIEGEASENSQGEFDFSDYALSGDLIATCFWASRNRLLGNMLGQWKNITEALWELKAQNKIAEWYETLKWIYPLTQWKAGFEEKFLHNLFTSKNISHCMRDVFYFSKWIIVAPFSITKSSISVPVWCLYFSENTIFLSHAAIMALIQSKHGS